jgi:hypothetical protein
MPSFKNEGFSVIITVRVPYGKFSSVPPFTKVDIAMNQKPFCLIENTREIVEFNNIQKMLVVERVAFVKHCYSSVDDFCTDYQKSISDFLRTEMTCFATVKSIEVSVKPLLLNGGCHSELSQKGVAL